MMQREEPSPPPVDGPRRRSVKRPRPILNCAECRRLKIRCDRQVPCSNCTKRGCAHICPQHTLGSMRSIRSRVSQLDRVQAWPPCDDGERDRERDPSTPGHEAPPSVSLTSGSPPTHGQIDAEAPRARTFPPSNETEEAAAVGTLVVNADGRSKFIGQSASFQWLRDETKEHPDTRPASPSRHYPPEAFPFQTHLPGDFPGLWAQLPPKEEAMHLVTCFHRHIAWNGSPILEDDLLAVFRWLYGLAGVTPEHPSMAVQLLALLYIVLALGSMTNMELAPDDPASMGFYRLSQQCLVAGKFLVNNSLTTVQTLSLMAKYAAYVGMPDMSWQIRGMAMRIMLAMGLHRDGQSWGLSPKDLNNRRRTFWETYHTDVLISCSWDRPSGLHSDMFDTQLPDDLDRPGNGGAGFERQRYRVAMLAQEALQESLKIRSDYQRMRAIRDKVLALEADVPFHLRNRAALQFMASRYATREQVEADTPPPARDLRVVLQSHDLVDCTSTLLLSMFRPYFIRALKEAAAAAANANTNTNTNPAATDPSQSPYAEAYLAVVERSRMLIANLLSLHALFPRISTRHWFFWNHAFSGAVIMATLCIASPGGPLVEQARSDLNAIIAVYTAIQPTVPYAWVGRNLQWLLEVRAKAEEKMLAFRSRQAAGQALAADGSAASEDATENPLLVGWRQRLVELHHREPDPVPNLGSGPGAGPAHGAILTTEPDVPDISLTGINVSDSDLLSQLLGLTAEGPQFVAPLKDMAMFDFGLTSP